MKNFTDFPVGCKVEALRPTRHDIVPAGTVGTVTGHDAVEGDAVIRVEFPHAKFGTWRCVFWLNEGIEKKLRRVGATALRK